MRDAYRDFLAAKSPLDTPAGLRIAPPLPSALKPFQRAIVTWALRRGRAAMFEGTGLGKTFQQLAWGRAVADETDAPLLILTPLAVAEQTVAEAEKFGIRGVHYAPDKTAVRGDLVVTNYERFDKFRVDNFAGIVLDESGIIKAQDGKTRAELTDACRAVPWRLCCSATPAPNDYTELGQHAEFLGVMTAKEMLAMFFVHDGSIRADDHSQTNDGWRLKRHAAKDFWRWLASWSVMVRHPSDLGFDEPGYDLPPLNLHKITVAAECKPIAGSLFPVHASTLAERIAVRRETVEERVAAAVKIIGETLFRDVLSSSCYLTMQKNGGAPALESATPMIPKGGQLLSVPQSRTGVARLAAPISARIMQPTKIDGTSGPRSSRSVITPTAESATLAIPNIEKLSNEKPKQPRAALPPKNGADALIWNTDSPLSNTKQCLESRAEDALFAEQKSLIGPTGDIMSTIATKPELSGVFSAQPAIAALDISRTTETCFTGRLNISATPPEKWIIWCKLNKEQDRLESILKDACFSVYGSLSDEEKRSRVSRWLADERPVLLTKPKICGWGLNFQSCHKMIFVGATDSFEETYQAVRRCWRFGQNRPVEAYFVASELEGNVVANLRKKEAAFEAMLDAMSGHMRDLMQETVTGRNTVSRYSANYPMEIPAWM